jgi:hypothetical protein
MLMLGGNSLADTFSSVSAADMMKRLELQGRQPTDPVLLAAASATVQAFCTGQSDSQLSKLPRLQAFAIQLCLTAATLPLLRVIEATSLPSSIIACVKLFFREQVKLLCWSALVPI